VNAYGVSPETFSFAAYGGKALEFAYYHKVALAAFCSFRSGSTTYRVPNALV